MKLCNCCGRCEKHCVCHQDCFDEGAAFEEYQAGCPDCEPCTLADAKDCEYREA